MAVQQIPNLPAAIALNGEEQIEAVQAGTSVRVTSAQIALLTSPYAGNPLLPALGGTGTGTIFTTGSVVFSGASGVYQQNNSKFFWDDANFRLGIGTVTPAYNLDVSGTAGVSSSLTIGVQQTTQGSLVLANTAAGAFPTTIKASNSASAAWTLTLPVSAGTNGYILTTNGSGVSSWTNPTALGIDLDIGSTAITGGTTGRVLYDNAGVLGEKAVTGSGDVVLATSPALITPALGTPTSGTLSSCSGLPISTGVSGLGTNVATALAVNVGTAGAVVVNGGALGTPSSGTLSGCSGLPISTGVSGLGTNVATALAVNVGTAGAVVVNGGALGTPSSGTLSSCSGLPISTGVSGLGANVATFLATPSSANLASAVTDETGSGALVFATAPTITGTVLAAGTASVAPLTFTSGTNLTSASSGNLEFDGSGFYSTITTANGRGYTPSVRRFTLFSAGGAITTIANYFGATSNIPLTANASYEIEIVLYYAKGGTGGTVVWTLTNSAVPTSMDLYYEMSPITAMVAPPGTATMLVGQAYNITTAAYTVTTGSITANTNQYARFKILLLNGAGTSLQVQATSSGSAITPGIGSYWTCIRIPSSNNGTYAA